jgi:O-antigen biosynthesis protein
MCAALKKVNSTGKKASAKLAKKPLVSIVVLAYNHLEYTKICIESIFKYTSHINYELITINNGSTDGTKKYLNSLKHKKKIDFVENVGPTNGFNAGVQAAAGEYTACVCNDIVLTSNWMDNLLKCIRSDEKIGFVTPGASSVSNCQRINGQYSNLIEMQQFAKEYNVSDPRKWEERLRLMPCVLLTRTELLAQIGFYDPTFYFGEFGDDDFSFRVRRAGYKLIYARDTFIYHFGSITTDIEHKKLKSLEVSRKLFMEKYGVDSWDDANFNPGLVDMLRFDKHDNISILGINTMCGGTPLQIKNRFKENGVPDVSIYNYTEVEKYVTDLKTVSDEVAFGKLEKLYEIYEPKAFDYIIIEKGLEQCTDLDEISGNMRKLLKDEGQLILKINNSVYVMRNEG